MGTRRLARAMLCSGGMTNKKIAENTEHWDARLLLFPRQAEQSFSIPTSLVDLPTIEDWCARNLTET